MARKVSRRKFLGTTLVGSVAVTAAPPVKAEQERAQRPNQSPGRGLATGLDSSNRQTLRLAMDEIIPATDGMPAASQVGGLEYLERTSAAEPQIRADLEGALDALSKISRRRFNAGFDRLASSERIQALAALETRSPEVFAKLRDHVYEAYYTQPSVWKLIGYEFHPTNQEGPVMKPFDESVLAKVRKMPKLYREAG